MSRLIPRNNPYWNRDLGKALEIEQREKLLEIVRPSAEDLRSLTVVRANAKPKRKLAQPTLTERTDN